MSRLVALAALAVVLSRVVGGEQKILLVELAVLVPFSAVAVAVALVAATLTGGRWTVGALAALLAVQLVWLAPALGVGVSAADPEPGSGELRVMTINVLTGLASADAIVSQVRQRRVDLLATSEITPGLQRELEQAGLSSALPYRIGQVAWEAEGTVLWSRWPIEPAPVITGTAFGQPRGVVVVPSGQRVTVTAVHTLSPIPGRVQRWRADVAAIEKGVREVDGPQIVLGDFNATRDHRGFRRMLTGEGSLVDAGEVVGVAGGAWPGFTWPANTWVPPFMQLDHVLLTPVSLGVKDLERVRIPDTDHFGLVATLTGRAPTPAPAPPAPPPPPRGGGRG